jgi:hypothetical protein
LSFPLSAICLNFLDKCLFIQVNCPEQTNTKKINFTRGEKIDENFGRYDVGKNAKMTKTWLKKYWRNLESAQIAHIKECPKQGLLLYPSFFQFPAPMWSIQICFFFQHLVNFARTFSPFNLRLLNVTKEHAGKGLLFAFSQTRVEWKKWRRTMISRFDDLTNLTFALNQFAAAPSSGPVPQTRLHA